MCLFLFFLSQGYLLMVRCIPDWHIRDSLCLFFIAIYCKEKRLNVDSEKTCGMMTQGITYYNSKTVIPKRIQYSNKNSLRVAFEFLRKSEVGEGVGGYAALCY